MKDITIEPVVQTGIEDCQTTTATREDDAVPTQATKEPRKVEIKLVDAYYGEPITMMQAEKHGQQPRKGLHINESENQTFDITPRERKQRPQSGKSSSRPTSGRKDLRYVKSRTDSGMSNVTGKTESRSRPGSGKKPISTITVNFLSESDSDDDQHKIGKEKSKPGKPDITGMISNMNLSDTEGPTDGDTLQGETDRPGSRPGSPSKHISRFPLNYYEFGMQVKPGRGPTEREEEKPKTITTKTIALLGDGDRTVQEFKTVSVLDHNQVSSIFKFTCHENNTDMISDGN